MGGQERDLCLPFPTLLVRAFSGEPNSLFSVEKLMSPTDDGLIMENVTPSS
jgi:hypothetical protein